MSAWVDKQKKRKKNGTVFSFFLTRTLSLFPHKRGRRTSESVQKDRQKERKRDKDIANKRRGRRGGERHNITKKKKRKKGELCEALVLEGAEEVLGDGRKGRAVNLCVATGALWLGGDGGDLLGETASAKDVRAVGLDGVEEHVVANGAKQLAVGVRAEWEDEGHGRGALVALCGRNERRGGSRKR